MGPAARSSRQPPHCADPTSAEYGQVIIAAHDELPRRAATWLAQTIADTVRARSRCSVALSGGSTPRGTYQELAAHALASRVPWANVHVYFGDERAVPPDHPDSNYHMAREALLAQVPIPETQIHRMPADQSDLQAAALEYGRLLPDRVDVLLLGAGTDGHTASLFPHAASLRERARRVVPARAPNPPFDRLTITPPVIADARHVMVMATGEEKAPVVAQALHEHASPEEIPVCLARHGTWFVDTKAAALLREGKR